MATYVFVPADTSEPVRTGEITNAGVDPENPYELRELLGDYINDASFDGDAVIYHDAQSSQVNDRATDHVQNRSLVAHHYPAVRNSPGFTMTGDVVITGIDRSGGVADVPERIADHFLNPPGVTVEVNGFTFDLDDEPTPTHREAAERVAERVWSAIEERAMGESRDDSLSRQAVDYLVAGSKVHGAGPPPTYTVRFADGQQRQLEPLPAGWHHLEDGPRERTVFDELYETTAAAIEAEAAKRVTDVDHEDARAREEESLERAPDVDLHHLTAAAIAGTREHLDEVQALNEPAEYEREMHDRLAQLRKVDDPVAAAGAAYVRQRLDAFVERSQPRADKVETPGRLASALARLHDAVQGRREWRPESPHRRVWISTTITHPATTSDAFRSISCGLAVISIWPSIPSPTGRSGP